MVKSPHGKNVTARVLQGYNICLLLFLIYVNDISRIFYQSKLFTDDTSLFSVIHDSQSSANDFIKDAEIYINGLFNGSWILTKTLLNKLKKLSLVVKQKTASSSLSVY